MKIAVDGFGGDNAPLSIIEGAALAVKEYGVEVVITGDEKIIKDTAGEHKINLDGITIVHTTDVISMCDDPTTLVKEHAQSSMAVAMKLVVDGKADAFVSAGSTGAIVVGASLIIKRIRGIKRPTIATVLPCEAKKGGDKACFLLLDGGANLDCRPEMLVQFAQMGSIYMEKVLKIKEPRIGLVNVGTEETKGRELQIETHALLKASKLNFTGNIEARSIPLGGADVVLADGFTGNIILKLTEGLASFLMGGIKGVFMNSIKGKLAAALVMGDMKKFKATMDYKEYGGAPLLGASKPVIKAHGSSDGYAIKNAIRQARDFTQNKVIEEVTRMAGE